MRTSTGCLIQEMQAEGLKLNAIQRLVGGGGDWAERFAGLRRAFAVALELEASEIITLAELEERFGPVERDPKSLDKAQRLGVLIPLGDGTFEVPSPALLRAAEEVAERSVPLPAALSAIERVQRQAESASRTFVKLFMDELWKPFNDAGRADEQWPQITESIERLRPLAAESLVALFKPLLAAEIEGAFGRALETQAKRKG
ncbi:MAG: hypothetical protein AVDCRST_MAG85-2894 [uncultured Solirubrobacteraceae bacterium]|uniref:Uncharacterized protein n=1 Tax=uncultured Solirubrobacteraceae bacterium TaxID=1162706 RepID=A0A6J4TF09_9ACTN|nr:MAG: hypothetical protein AVDCRST_MAG85-2894 [uncultured Solirubrobacteraceae bacterium]